MAELVVDKIKFYVDFERVLIKQILLVTWGINI